MASQGMIKCTFSDCFQYFSSDKDLRRHKKHNREHDYCRVCDLDFEDWDQYSGHNALYSGRDAQGKLYKEWEKDAKKDPDNVRVPKGDNFHMYGCAKCGELFKTESGRQRHTNGAHQIDQNIKCPGCPGVFSRAAGLIFHMEQGRCRSITAIEFKGHLQHKILVSRLLQDPMVIETLSSTDYKSYLEAATDNDKKGGIPLTDVDIVWEDGYKMPQPLIPGKPKVLPRMLIHQQVWPDIREANGGGVILLGKQIGEPSLNDFKSNTSKLSVEAWPLPEGFKKGDTPPPPPKLWNNTATTAKELFQGAEPTRPPSDWEEKNKQITLSNNKSNILHYTFLDPTHRDIERFYNPLIEKYKCPLPDCIERFDTARENTDHIESAHPIEQRRCPHCQKWFKSYTALISHCEAPNSRCGISYTNKFGQAIHEFSGGFLAAAAAARPDLTMEKDGYRLAYMKYESSVPQDWEKGVDDTTTWAKL